MSVSPVLGEMPALSAKNVLRDRGVLYFNEGPSEQYQAWQIRNIPVKNYGNAVWAYISHCLNNYDWSQN